MIRALDVTTRFRETHVTNRILLVEDDAASRRLLAAMLHEMGNAVTSAASGDEALRYLYAEEGCDVVISDILMPNMSGIELARRMRDARPGLPVIFVTGEPSGIDIALDNGALALPKPVVRSTLSEVLDEALGSVG